MTWRILILSSSNIFAPYFMMIKITGDRNSAKQSTGNKLPVLCYVNLRCKSSNNSIPTLLYTKAAEQGGGCWRCKCTRKDFPGGAIHPKKPHLRNKQLAPFGNASEGGIRRILAYRFFCHFPQVTPAKPISLQLTFLMAEHTERLQKLLIP